MKLSTIYLIVSLLLTASNALALDVPTASSTTQETVNRTTQQTANRTTQQTTSIEAKIADQVKSHSERALSTLQKVVNINSGTMNFKGVEMVANIFRSQLEGLGFETQWVDGSHFNRAGHLLATHTSQSPNKPKLLLIGHLDTVFAKDDSFQKFERIDSTHIAGPGITDMKGGDVIMIEALSALQSLGLLDDMNIKVVMTGDEELSGKPLSASKKALIDAANWADIALGFEDGDSNINTAVIARRGSVGWSLNVVGKPAHSSQIFQPDVGYGAAFETARILNEFREQLAGVGDLTFNPGMIIAGTTINHNVANATGDAFGKDNVIARTAKVTGGIRALSLEELNNAKSIMQDIAADNLAHTSATLNFDEGYPPMSPTFGNKLLLELYSDVSESLGYNKVIAVNPRNAGAADISFTAGLVEMSLDGLGLMGSGGHTNDEVADITSLLKNTQKAAILIYRLSKSKHFGQSPLA